MKKNVILALVLGALCLVLAFMAPGMKAGDSLLYSLITVMPLLVILGLLCLQVNMLPAALAGGILAMIIGQFGLAAANKHLLAAIPAMLSITVPIVNSAVATAVFKAGGYTAALTLVRRGIGGRLEFVGAFIVILQGAATYMSGIGGGSAMVIAPLAFAAVGAIPEVVAGMSIAAAVCFTTSPASLETGIVSKLAGINAQDYVTTMRPFTVFFMVLAVLIAFVGTKRRKALFQGEESEEYKNKTSEELWKATIPAIFLLVAVIAGPMVNSMVGFPVLGPLSYMVVTIGLIFVCTKFTLNQSVDALVDGSQYILTRLFQVGIFLAFINLIGDIGAFSTIAGVAKSVPTALMIPAAVVAGFCIGVPAGAYVGSILTLVLPVAVALGFSPLAVGFVTMGVGLGSQLSFVNITMQALSYGFQIPIIQVIRGNMPWVGLSMGLLIACAAFLA